MSGRQLKVSYLPARRSTPRPTAIPAAPPEASRHGSDPRYHTQRWKRARQRVLRRDSYQCRIVEGCPSRATVADHIIAVFPGMPDELFFGDGNLRAGCRPHNLARGFTAAAGTPVDPASTVVRGDYS